MRRKLPLLLALILAGISAACTGSRPSPASAQPVEIIVSAAASLTDALKEAQSTFEAAHTGVKIRFNFGSSGALQQQIEQGAPVDLFISAATEPMERLVSKGLVHQNSVKTLASNKVVLIRSQSHEAVVHGWADLNKGAVQRIALGNPQHVPAGQYGKEVMEHLSLWGAVQNRLVLAEDVRQVLQFVGSGEVQAGIVYATDVATAKNVALVAEAPPGSHPPVVYPVAVLKESRNASQARLLADFLLSAEGRQILTKYGFTTAD